MGKYNRVLVIYKNLNLSKPSSRESRPHWITHQKVHHDTLKHVIDTLKSRGCKVITQDRARVKRHMYADLLISVGGDGTVLTAAHYAGDIPVLGVNSMPKASVGFFCAATGKTFAPFLDNMLNEKLEPVELPLLEACIDGKPLPFPALNDILLASVSPAEAVYYQLKTPAFIEMQRSSGLWITAGPGSTAGYRSAGGKPLDLTCSRLHYLVREPLPVVGKKYHHLQGSLAEGKALNITSLGGHGVVYVDGSALIKPLRRKSQLTVSVARQKFHLFLRQKNI